MNDIKFKIYLKEGSVNKVDSKLIEVEQQIQAIRKRRADQDYFNNGSNAKRKRL